jgi:hypothetical protein
MGRSRPFLIFALMLAVAWTAWLGYQAATSADPVVVSRPQILVAPVVVEAKIYDKNGSRAVKVVRVYVGHGILGLDGAERESAELHIDVPELADESPGSYLLALQENTFKKGEFQLVPTPTSPGYSAKGQRPPIYPATESTRLQVLEALRQFHRQLAGE